MKRLWAGYLYGRAIGRFYQKKYADAASIFEKVCRLESDTTDIELCYSFLGRSYLALNNYDKAVDYLSQAYQRFKDSKQKERVAIEYKNTLIALSEVLRIIGRVESAQEIDNEILRRKERGIGDSKS